VVVNLFEGVMVPSGGTGAVDQALGGLLSDLIAAGDLRGKWGDFTLVHTQGKLASPRVVVAGLGKAEKFDIDRVRDLATWPATSAATSAISGSDRRRLSPTARVLPASTHPLAAKPLRKGRHLASIASSDTSARRTKAPTSRS
jgi:hypothetical protein